VKFGVNLILVVSLSLMMEKIRFVVRSPLDLPLSYALVSHLLDYCTFRNSVEEYVFVSDSSLHASYKQWVGLCIY
jgi:hypothetical protein